MPSGSSIYNFTFSSADNIARGPVHWQSRLVWRRVYKKKLYKRPPLVVYCRAVPHGIKKETEKRTIYMYIYIYVYIYDVIF